METKTKKCEVCGKEITGYGQEDLDNNYNAHMKQQHEVFEAYTKEVKEIKKEVVKKPVIKKPVEKKVTRGKKK